MPERHFTLLGYRDCRLITQDDDHYLRGIPGTGLDVLRETLRDTSTPDTTCLAPGATKPIDVPKSIFLAKANLCAIVHRSGYLDYIGIKLLDAEDQVYGQRRFPGMYTSNVYVVPVENIPLVRRKVADVIRRMGFLPDGYLAKALVTILEQYPRDGLFQIDVEALYDITLGIPWLQGC